MKNKVSIREAVQEVELLALATQVECGISLIDSGDYKRAFAIFSVGIRLTKQILLNVVESNGETSLNTTTTKTDSAIIATTAACCSLPTTLEDSSSSSEQNLFKQDKRGNHPLVFSRPLPIWCSTTGTGQDATPSDECLKIRLAFVQVYNLALTVHLSALEADADHNKRSKQVVEKKLQQALSLYECAAQMDASDSIALQLSMFESLALVNNMGHIHLLLGNIKDAQDCFERVLVILLNLANENDNDEIHQLLHEGFMRNALSFFLLSNGSCPAAAAA